MPHTEDDIFRILLATDIHLGYAEKDPIRGNDSINTFEEILSIAAAQKVDFVLLGGDLFHENKPSRQSMYACSQLLRKYCFGSNSVKFEIISDQSENFKHNPHFPHVNYMDPNMNIAIPVFSIHGNHDDPTGPQQLCNLDLLSSTGAINFFGKTLDLSEVVISPILMRKGHTKLALYGLGAIRDERLHRLFKEQKVLMHRPKDDKDSFFNMFVLHQNRAKHGETNYIPENFLARFLDLVFWGHEHQCRIEPEMSSNGNVYITQPGSSVATSLSKGEADPKQIGLLEVAGKEFKLTPIPLKTVRPFYIESVNLWETSLNLVDSPNPSQDVLEYCVEVANRLIGRAEDERAANPKRPEIPLIRLCVEYEDQSHMFSLVRFQQIFAERVANPKDMVLFSKKRAERKKKGDDVDEKALGEVLDTLTEGMDIGVLDLVQEYFEKAEVGNQMQLLTNRIMSAAISEFTEKDEKDAIELMINSYAGQCKRELMQRDVEEDDLVGVIDNLRREYGEDKNQLAELEKVVKDARKNRTSVPSAAGDADMDIDENDDGLLDFDGPLAGPSRGRGAARGRARGRGTRGGAKAAAEPSTRGRGRGSRARASTPRGGGARGAAAKNTIADAFQRAATNRSRSSTNNGSDQEEVTIDDSDDEDFSFGSSNRRAPTSRASPAAASQSQASSTRSNPPRASQSKKKKPVLLSSSDDEL